MLLAQDMVHMPCEGPPSPNAVPLALAQTMPSPHCVSAVQAMPSVELPTLPPPPPPLTLLAPARPTARPAPAMMLPPATPLAPALGPPVASSLLPQLAVAATVASETMKSVNQVRALITEAS
jgi:hypothetical protein